MSERLEVRYPCPVCLGTTLEKATIEGAQSLVIDHCPRCGGVWFEQGEVQRMRTYAPEDLLEKVAAADDVRHMQCHSCSAFFDRALDRCPTCGWNVKLDCPSCGVRMESATHAGIRLDACRHCRGVWFDRHELEEIWRLEFNGALARRGSETGDVVLAALAYDPFLTFYAAHAAGHVLAAGAQAAPAVLEAAGEAASSVFETIVEIISGFFG